MTQNSDFKNYVTGDALLGIDGVTSRALFGGYGLYKDGVIFGIIVEDAMYLKVDETNRKDYEAFGSHAFEYEGRDNKKVSMSYWMIPEEVLENRTLLEELVFQSVAINASKKQSAKSKKKRR